MAYRCLNRFGGHAIFIDALNSFPLCQGKNSRHRFFFPRSTLKAEVRGAEIGTLMADRDPVTRENRFPVNEFVRLALPRRVYTNNHIDYVAAIVANVH